jgi:Uma2 family endonuclease
MPNHETLLLDPQTELGDLRLPTEDDLPYSDGMPMESQRHVLQLQLLMQSLQLHWAERNDVFIGGNMFVYFSAEQVKDKDFRGPDFFVVLNVPRRERKSWVVWQEGKGPDLVIELLSESTAAVDRGEKKQVCQDRLRVPEYFLYDPMRGELTGFVLSNRKYRPLEPDAGGHVYSAVLELSLARWEGVYEGVEASWLRFALADGSLLPTPQERAEQEHERAEQEHERAEQEHERAEQEHERAEREKAERDRALARAEEAERRLAELEARLGQAPDSPDRQSGD